MFHILSIILFTVPALITRKWGRQFAQDMDLEHKTLTEIYSKKIMFCTNTASFLKYIWITHGHV